MAGMRAGQVELALQVGERDIEIDHGHLGGVMAEQFHQDRNINAATEHLAGIGVTELVRNNGARDAGSRSHLAEISAQLPDEHPPGNRAR